MGKPVTDDDLLCRYEPITESGCWIWSGCIDLAGYGKFKMARISHVPQLAHRFFYEKHRGIIPAGLTLDHLCRVPCCVNPYHLEVVSHRTNVLRGIAPPAKCAMKTHCPRGHEYTEQNTFYRPQKGWTRRVCKTCDRCRQKEIRETRRDKIKAEK